MVIQPMGQESYFMLTIENIGLNGEFTNAIIMDHMHLIKQKMELMVIHPFQTHFDQ